MIAGARWGRPVARWWRQRTLHTRLSLLVTGAVSVAVLALAGLAWGAVAEIQHRQLQSQLSTDAQAIAAEPGRWPATSVGLPGSDLAGLGNDRHGPHDLGPRWQILDPTGTVVSQSTSPLPVTAAARKVAAGLSRPAQESILIGDDRYLMLTVPATGGGAVQVAIDQSPAARTLTVFGVAPGRRVRPRDRRRCPARRVRSPGPGCSRSSA